MLGGLAQAVPITASAAFDLVPYQDSYYVQQPWNLPLADRFSVTTGAVPIYNTWDRAGDAPLRPGSTTGPRTEMHWWTIWTGNEHMWGAYVWVDPGTNATIMQIKSTDAKTEALFIGAHSDGTIDNAGGGAIAHNMLGHWFWMVTDFNPATTQAHIWINGSLALSTTHGPGNALYYFKNGVYGVGSTHYADVQFWSGTSSPTAPPPAPAQLPPAPTGGPNGSNPVTPPGPASGLTSSTQGAGQAVLTWSPADPGSGSISAYAVYIYGSDGSSQMKETATDIMLIEQNSITTYTATGLNPGVYYTYTVLAWNQSAWGQWAQWAPWLLAT